MRCIPKARSASLGSTPASPRKKRRDAHYASRRQLSYNSQGAKKNRISPTGNLGGLPSHSNTILVTGGPPPPLPPSPKSIAITPSHYVSKSKKNRISPTGNRTPASCELFRGMTSRNTDHYTIEDIQLLVGKRCDR